VLSYRHSFHAGNFADVLKHIILIEILKHLCEKDKPFDYFDSHAGAGLYSLISKEATKKREFEQGIAQLNISHFPELSDYLNLINSADNQNNLEFYPGSPLIAKHFLRSQDKGWLFELHPTDFNNLQTNFQHNRRFKLQKSDGFKGLLAVLPPQSRRGVILIDPSYEIKTDYSQIVDTVIRGYKKFSTGTYAVWYPVVERHRVQRLIKQFIQSGIRDIQRYELGVRSDSMSKGMTASGMIIVNPPWKLMTQMKNVLPRLTETLKQDEGAFFKADILVKE